MVIIQDGRLDPSDFQHRLKAFSDVVLFAPGSVLREKGQHYTSMYLVTEGQIEVDLGIKDGVLRPGVEGLGLPIGEFGFLRGSPANATVRALSEVRAFEIRDDTLSALDSRDPELSVELMRFLGQTADERSSYNIALSAKLDSPPSDPAIQILLCRDKDMLLEAMRLRYDVYCRELGRQSPHADHDEKTISDELDAFGHTFIAVENGMTIGTLRANRPADGPVGTLETLYGMNASAHHPESTVVCTKFIVATKHRNSSAGIKLVAGFARFGLQNGLRECYMDCIPKLRPFYMGMGFKLSGEKFLHRENGPSYPMMIDLVKYKGRIERVLLSLK